MGADTRGELTGVDNRAVIEFENHVTDPKTCLGGGAIRLDLGYESAIGGLQFECIGESLIKRLHFDAETRVHDFARLDNLVLYLNGLIDRNRE